MNFNVQIDARCSSAAPWAVVNASGVLVACHVLEDDARRDASDRMDGVPLATGPGTPPGIASTTDATGHVTAAPARTQPMVGSQGGLVYAGGTGGRGEIAQDGIETRSAMVAWPTLDLEIRSQGDGMHFRGYAAVFNSDSQPLPFIETIEPGAFARSLGQDRDIKMFFNHDPNQLLATRKAGTLRLSEDSRGLLVDADLPDTTSGTDLAKLIKRGDVDNMSFTFKKDGPNGDRWSEDGARRSLRQVKLFEVSPMTEWAAYQGTSASVRSLGVLASRVRAREADLSAAFRKLGGGAHLTPDEAYLLARVAASLSEGRAWSSAASDAASGAQALSSLLYLLSSESDEPDQLEMLRNSIGWLQAFIDAEMTEVGTAGDNGMRRLNPPSLAKARLALLARA